MTRDMYEDGVNIYLMWTKLNLLQELENQIKPKNNKRTKMNQSNKLEDQNDN